MTTAPTNEMLALADRCREIREWQKTGLLCDGAIRELAKTMPAADEHQNLHLAESKTAEEAMDAVIRLAATPSARDVREALLAIQQHVEDIRERAFSAGDLPKALGDIHTAGGNIVDEIDAAIASLSAPVAKARKWDDNLKRYCYSDDTAKSPAVSEADVGRPQECKHEFCMFPVGTDGRLLTSVNGAGYSAAGMFCRHCFQPQAIQSAAQGGGTEGGDGSRLGNAGILGADGVVYPNTTLGRAYAASTVKPRPSDPPSQEASAPPTEGGR